MILWQHVEYEHILVDTEWRFAYIYPWVIVLLCKKIQSLTDKTLTLAIDVNKILFHVYKWNSE